MILDAYWNQEVVVVHFLNILASYYHRLLVGRFLQMAKSKDACTWVHEVQTRQIASTLLKTERQVSACRGKSVSQMQQGK